MTLYSSEKASEFFAAKLEFTTGPFELDAMTKSHENVNILDVRSKGDFLKGHIPGAVALPQEIWEDAIGLSKYDVNIFYCYSEVCHLAARAAKFFADKGYAVMELQGGFDQWQRSNLPIEKIEHSKV
jgi:rhodanese-related sulfurtransferase